MIRALFLDAAGTLIEPLEPVADVYVRHAAHAGIQVDPAAVRAAFGEIFTALPPPDYPLHADGDAAEREWWRTLVGRVFRRAAAPGPLPAEFPDRVFPPLFDHYADASAWRFFPEVPAVLADARAAGLRLAVVSNFDRRLHRILAGLGLEFDAIVTSADARCRKPGPAIFRHALVALGLEPHHVVHGGDHAVADLGGAAAAGIAARRIHRPHADLRAFLDWALAV